MHVIMASRHGIYTQGTMILLPAPVRGWTISFAGLNLMSDPTKPTKPETNEKAVAAVKRWMVKHGYSTGGSDNIEFMLTNLEGQMWDRVRAAAAKVQK